MTIAPGTRLTHYEVLAPIGKGGMGEVYRARDTKLVRDVAIKVLPEELAASEERLQRFQREAKVLASLNHPNIAAIYGVEETDGTHYLVLELVEGETLAERIARGPVPLDEAVAIASQIADALEDAHERGIIHRDLKPANIKLTPGGKVKVLDFGLAKAFGDEPSGGQGDDSVSPTLTRDATRAGVILGTAAYMSPEQAKGRQVDKRADIWAFGVVLYEMLTARRAFAGEDISETLAAVLKSDPDWERLSRNVPGTVTQIVKRCLQKQPASRMRDIGDARIELQEALASSEAASDVVPQTLGVRSVLMVGSGLLVGGLAMWAILDDPPPPAEVRAAHAVLELPPEAPLALGARVPLIGFDSPAIAISPDGSEVVYVGGGKDGTQLYRRPVGSSDVTEIPGTEGAIYPFFSPDGQWLGFLTESQVKKVRLDGGAPETLANVATPVRASWARDNTIYIATVQGYSLTALPADGAGVHVLVDESTTTRSGDVLPDGSAVLLTDNSRGVGADFSDIVLLDLETLERRPLIERAYDARYISTGHLVFARSGNLLAVPFDLERREVTGEATTVASNVAMDSLFGRAHFAASDNGTLVYISGGDLSSGKPAWVERTGATEFLPVEERVYNALDLAPDDERVAVQVADVNDYIWIYDLARDEGRRLQTRGAGFPRWSTDGGSIAFATLGLERNFLGLEDLETSTPARELFEAFVEPGSWSPEDGELALSDWADWAILFLDVTTGETRRWDYDAHLWAPAFSPDGRWIAYASDQTGQFEIWIRSYPDGETARQISADYGTEPIWSATTGELYYRKANQWMATRVNLEPELSWEPPRLVFETDDFIDTNGYSYDVTSDGQRLLIVKRTRPPVRDKIEVVFNWFSELERLAPTSR